MERLASSPTLRRIKLEDDQHFCIPLRTKPKHGDRISVGVMSTEKKSDTGSAPYKAFIYSLSITGVGLSNG